jgi:hypothetical protein
MSADEEDEPILLYFEQDGTTITGMFGITGTLIGTDLEFHVPFPEDPEIMMYFSGQFAGDDVVGTFIMNGSEPEPWHMVRPHYTFGTLTVNGVVDGATVDIDSETALGVKSPIINARIIRFVVEGAGAPWPQTYEIRSWGQNFAENPPPADPYQVGHFFPTESETSYELVAWSSDSEDSSNYGGALTIATYEADNRIVGSFVSDQPPNVVMTFDLTVGDGGTVYIDSIAHNASNVQEYSVDYNEVAVLSFATETGFVLRFGNGQDILPNHTYDSFALSRTLLTPGLHAGFGGGEGGMYGGGDASSGEIRFDRYDSTGMSGSFGNVNLIDTESSNPAGSVSGTFNVSFELEFYY